MRKIVGFALVALSLLAFGGYLNGMSELFNLGTLTLRGLGLPPLQLKKKSQEAPHRDKQSKLCQKILNHFPEQARTEGVKHVFGAVRLPDPLQARIQEEIQRCIPVVISSPYQLELEVFSSEQESWTADSDLQFQMSLIRDSTGNKEEETAFSVLMGQLEGLEVKNE